MALAFNVSRAGPLAQVSIGPGELMAAYQIATGIYGWWKARERTESLVHLLESHQCSLSAPSSFSHTAYVRARVEHGQMTGIVVQNGAISSVPLPKASTALPNDRGQACLRALTCAILCLYGTDATTAVLREVIPSALLRRDLEDLDVDFNDGPLVPALKQWVKAVATEEDCDATRDFLLRQVAINEQRLSGIPFEDIMNINLREERGELPLITGVIKWSLTPSAQREQKTYATRSIRAWSMAAILSNLGFEVMPARYIVHSLDGQSSFVANEVYVVASHGPETDYLANTICANDSWKVLGQDERAIMTPFSGIPVLLFRFLGGSPYNFDVGNLQKAFTSSFLKVRQAYLENTESKFSKSDHRSLLPMIPALHRSLLSGFINCTEPEISNFGMLLLELSSSTIDDYIPQTANEDPSWAPSLMQACLHYSGGSSFLDSVFVQGLYNCNIFKAIILGSLYGVYSRFIKITGDENSILHQDILFNPNIASPESLKYLILFEHRLSRVTPFNIFKFMFLGENLDRYSRIEAENHKSLIGMSLNGFTIVSDLPDPFQVAAVFTEAEFYLIRGQPLNIPTDHNGKIWAYKRPRSYNRYNQFEIRPPSIVSTLRTSDNLQYEGSLRIDVELSWESEPQKILWKARNNGVSLMQICLNDIQRHAGMHSHCSCGDFSRSVDIPPDLKEEWFHLPISRLFATAPNGARYSPRLKRERRIFVDASANKATTIVALSLLKNWRYVEIIWDCFKCSLERFRDKIRSSTSWGEAVLLAAWTIHENQSTEDTN